MNSAVKHAMKRLLLPTAAAMGLSGCANQPPLSLEHMEEVDTETSQEVALNAAAESRKLLATVERLQAEIEQRSEATESASAEPAFDPLEEETLSLSLSDAHISDALRALSANSSLSLIIDPSVLDLEQRATLALRDVSTREALDSILDVYNVYGQVRGQTLRVQLMQEKMYPLDFLNTASDLQISDGGNVFGAGTGATGGGGSGTLRGNLSLDASGGGSEKPFEAVERSVRAIIGQEQGDTSDEADTESGQRRQGSQHTNLSIDPLSGTLYVKGRPDKVNAVDQYISQLQHFVGRQVFIEAQLIDVRLSDGYRFGIDWTLLRDNFGGVITGAATQLGSTTANLPNAGGELPGTSLTIPQQNLTDGNGTGLGIAYRDNNFGAILQALDSFGSVSVLSNPNILARNGTPAMLSVGTTSRFVSSSSVTQTAPGGGATTTTADVETDSVFSGVMVGVVPFVRENGSVELLIRPTQTTVDQSSLRLIDVGGSTRVSLPEVNLKGLTTTLRLNDGDVVLIGGLIDQTTDNLDEGVPGASSVPFFGRLFGSQQRLTEIRELVIALRVRVL
ncbi:pilus (MSHA type) biogenesis protein MshL [Halomonas sp. CUBES01]|uniref:Pilus (MSHA type) biogenesis protein MshL n=1 Tax=Vreelandella gomseomensis TaxID=370766 RepID=A0ABU1GEG0_9GAMM|nr:MULTISPECIES: pilus (MSHA type) biogenesis protein MshL [Halomonas]MDR5875434.1 pilus (MSHA type) biogenesis protein MshL [Halomonas gomseomensis]MEC4766271.1 pilus (MSHA type) biogenesis protein MshL [Halomonas sp. CUBES01]